MARYSATAWVIASCCAFACSPAAHGGGDANAGSGGATSIAGTGPGVSGGVAGQPQPVGGSAGMTPTSSGGQASGAANGGASGTINGGSAGTSGANGGNAAGAATGGGGASTGGSSDTSCPSGATGVHRGDLMQNFTLSNQDGQSVSLHDFCGKVVLIELGAGWCPYCRAEAQLIPELMTQYGPQGFVVLSILAEDPRTDPPDQTFLRAWADEYELSTPVLGDPGWTIRDRYPDLSSGTPNCMLVGRDGKIKELTDDKTFCLWVRNQIPEYL